MTPFQRVVIRIGALAALSLAALTACTVVEEGGRPRPRPEPSFPQMCTMEYDPVCASDGGDRRTFSNACQARADGYRITGRGECRAQGRPDRPDDRPQVCTRQYAPVCGRKGRREQTFANACMAEAEGFRVIDDRECRRPDNRPVDDSDMRPPRDPDRRPGREPEGRPDRDRNDRLQRACTREYAPVCGHQGQQRETFANACTAQAQGFRVIDDNPCQ